METKEDRSGKRVWWCLDYRDINYRQVRRGDGFWETFPMGETYNLFQSGNCVVGSVKDRWIRRWRNGKERSSGFTNIEYTKNGDRNLVRPRKENLQERTESVSIYNGGDRYEDNVNNMTRTKKNYECTYRVSTLWHSKNFPLLTQNKSRVEDSVSVPVYLYPHSVSFTSFIFLEIHTCEISYFLERSRNPFSPSLTLTSGHLFPVSLSSRLIFLIPLI